MQVHEPSTKLSNLQLELLKIFSFNPSDQELADIKDLLTKYFSEKAEEGFENMAAENGWNSDTYLRWANEHNRASSPK